jgi:hypothetical protein
MKILGSKCGGCCGCTIGEDAFGSADALSDSWTGDTGSFTKAAGEVTTTTASKMIRHTGENFAVGYEFTVRVRLKGSNAADKVRLIGMYYDASNYLFIEIATAATATMKLYQRYAGTDTQLGSTRTLTGKTTGDWISVKLCMYNDTAYAEAVAVGATLVTSGAIVTGAPQNRGGFAGLATDSMSGTATFDDFLHEKNRNTDATCPQCDACDTLDYSDSFTVEEFGWSDAYFRFTLDGGKMKASVNTSTNQNLRCMVRPTLSVGTVIENSVLIYDTDTGGSTDLGIVLNSTLGGIDANTMYLEADWTAANDNFFYGIGGASATIAQAPADGDKLTIRATCDQVSPQRWDVEFLINDVVKATQSNQSITVANPFYHGLRWSITNAGGRAQWDNYEISTS